MNGVIEHGTEKICRLRCVGVRLETQDAKSYCLQRIEGNPLTIQPGQFLNLVFRIDGEDVLRSYSVSSSFRAERVTITVKRIANGRVSNWLFDHLKPGDEVVSLGVAGNFSIDAVPSGPILLLTAGSGITPAAAMLRSFIDLGAETDVVMVHFATSPEDMIFREEMAHWARSLLSVRIIPVVTRRQPFSGWVGMSGRLSARMLAALVSDIARRQVFCCGPSGFMADARNIATSLGVPADRFLTESFEAAPDAGTEVAPDAGAFSVTFAKSGKTGRCDATTSTVLKAAKAADVRIMNSCNKGVCGTCRVKMLSGTVEINHQGGIRQREIDQGFIPACCSRPTSDIVIDR